MSSVKAQIIRPSEKPIAQEVFDKIDDFIAEQENLDGALINVLHMAQSTIGYLPREVMAHVAHKMGLSSAEVFGVVSFYSFFSTKPVGKCKISICTGTACFVKGANVILEAFEKELGIKAGETTKDGMFTLREVRCIGACGLAPVMTAEESVYGHIKVEDVSRIIQEQTDIIFEGNEH
ncbi:MAG: NAD(P)H-dependent oxidoreductase subunit E [Clostridiales bacterium]|nr:MAG: NAD(P)H-dependent oxidoreductase subunit E [Clostridiales bacterium]